MSPGAFSRFIKGQLSPSIVVRSAPQNGWRLLRRCAVSLIGFILGIVLLAREGLPYPWFYFPAYLIFVAGLEYLAGSFFMAGCYAVPAALAAGLGYFAGIEAPHAWFLYGGLLGSAGALSRFLRYGPFFAVAVLAAAEALIYWAAGVTALMAFPPAAMAVGFACSLVFLRGE